MDFSRGKKNPHMKTNEKRPCEKCGMSVDHYIDGTVSKHKVYLYRKLPSGSFKLTDKYTYCDYKKWR